MEQEPKILGLLEPSQYPQNQRELVEEFNRRLLEITECRARLTMTISRKEQYRQNRIGHTLRTYNINISKRLIEDEIYNYYNGEETPVLESLGLPIPCPLGDFISEMAAYIQDPGQKEAYCTYLDPARLEEAFDNGENDQYLQYISYKKNGEIQRLSHTMALVVDPDCNELIATCSVRDVTREMAEKRRMDQAKQTLNSSNRVIEGLTQDYHTIWLVDEKTMKMELYKCSGETTSDGVVEMFTKCGTYGEAFDKYVEGYISEKDREKVRRIFGPDLVEDRLKKAGIIRINYQRMDGRYQQCVLAKNHSVEDQGKFVLGFQDVDALMRHELEMAGQEERAKQYWADIVNMELIHETMGSGSWSIDFNEKCEVTTCSWSDTFRHMLGYQNEEEFPNEMRAWTDLLYGEDKTRVIQAFWDAITDYSGQTHFDEQYRMYTKDQGVRWFHGGGRLSRREDGSPVTFVGLFRDIDDEKTAQQAVQEQQAIVEALSRDYLNIYKIHVKAASAEIIKMAGYQVPGIHEGEHKQYAYDAVCNTYAKSRVYEEDQELFLRDMDLHRVQQELADKEEYVSSYRAQENGEIHYYQFKFFRMQMDSSEDTLIAAFKNIDAVMKATKERENLRIRSEKDLMTDLLNRGSGESKVTEILEEGTAGMLCILDIDNFKAFNDTYGHSVGDKVITSVAGAVKDAFRDADIKFRLGGDEFAAFAPNVVSITTGSRILQRFVAAIDAIVIPEIGETPVTTSIGVAFAHVGEKINFQELYKLADSGVYESKKRAGNQVTFKD